MKKERERERAPHLNRDDRAGQVWSRSPIIHVNDEAELHYAGAMLKAPYARPVEKPTSHYTAHTLLTVHFHKLPERLISTDLPAELNKVQLIFGSRDFSYPGWPLPKFVFKPLIRANTFKRTK